MSAEPSTKPEPVEQQPSPSPSLRALTLAPEDDAWRDRLLRMLLPWRLFTSPVFLNDSVIGDERPLMFVGNHTIYGVFDTALLFEKLYREHNILLRSMGDHVHFKIPLWRQFLERFGVVHGTPEAADALLARGESILVFPGGAREVARRKNEKYPVIWKQRMGFARLAIKHGCTIIPFSAVGMDDAFDVVIDAEDIHRSRIAPVLRALNVRKDATMPWVRGMGRTPLPRPERLYFRFGTPVRTDRVKGRQSDDTVVRGIREQVRVQVEQGIAELLEYREQDPARTIKGRVKETLRKVVPLG